ncbi:NACHT, LRR and PYD domains-containing protein 3 [Labeo rohita]|uniref:NACHT, LRR and PYD domains-containing protein 3 n=1 Tax=Labeo rohita TaxID=84645 RepID=UPI0021E29492|nr:NACHT, LRR and PYD domains-containing protein 3 [Labeo rohita]
MRDIKEAALDMTLFFLRDMKQVEAADALQDELVLIHQQPLKSTLKRRHKFVSEGIAKQGDSKLLNNIYTDLYMTLDVSKQVNNQSESRKVEADNRQHKTKDISVECQHLFEDKKIRTVLTKGVAGIGKSIFVQKFILDWADGKENKDITFIFPLAFREMNLKENEKQSLTGLMSQFFPEIKGLNLARNDKFKLLFILDGLDECRLPLNFERNEICRDVSSQVSLDVLLTNLIMGNLLPSALIWITTRPAAAIKIPPECINRVTEVHGFDALKKEEYFRKRFRDADLANKIINDVKESKSLFIMCYIPVFCWISATVFQNILEEKRNDLKNNQADDASKTQKKSNTEDTCKTLTQMYTHFLRFQILQSHRKYDGQYTPDVSWDKDVMLSLGKLAFDQLQRNNLLFYDTDLESCGIDASKASVYSGMCTQIFKEERGIILGTTFCFVHLSIQEFIAALYAHLFLDVNKKSVFVHKSTEQENKIETMIDLLKTAVDKALESETGHLDLFLRFLLGFSLQTNRKLLRGLLEQQGDNDQNDKEIVQYIKHKLNDNLSPERSINLFYCLNELNDQTLVKDIQTQLKEGSLSSADLSPAQWSAVAFVLLRSEEAMEKFELQKFQKSDECLFRLLEVVKISKKALLNDCGLTNESCLNLAKALGSDNNLTELNMSNNKLQDSGVSQLCTGLENVTCKLEILKLSKCVLTKESCSALASVLSSDSSSLKQLDLSNNNLQDAGVKILSDGLKENCKLEVLSLSKCNLTEESCSALASVLSADSTSVKDLDLSKNNLQDSGVKILSDGLKENCKLEKLMLCDCKLTEESCSALATVLKSNPCLKELDMSNNNLQDLGVKKLLKGLENPNCTLQKLRLCKCGITEKQCLILTASLKSNPSHLRELDISGNKLGDGGVKSLGVLLSSLQCKLEKLNLCGCSITENQCVIMMSALFSNFSHLRELNLSENKIKNTGVKILCDVLKDSHCKLERLRLSDCGMTDEGCSDVTSALKSNPSHLRELDLNQNELGDSGVKNLSDLLMNPQCKLGNLELCKCSITEKQCIILASALKSNPSHLRELNLSDNKIKDKGVNHLCDVLKDSYCKLERLSLDKDNWLKAGLNYLLTPWSKTKSTEPDPSLPGGIKEEEGPGQSSHGSYKKESGSSV